MGFLSARFLHSALARCERHTRHTALEDTRMSLDSLQDLYIEQIQDLYSAETQIVEALPKMIEKANNSQLKAGFRKHLEETREHVRRLEAIAERAGEDADGKTCKGMEGLIKEGAEVLKEDGDEAVIDAALISAAQHIEHYEMAGYGCARTFAQALGLNDDASMLQETLDEEGETDESLTQLAESIINPEAASSMESERGINVSKETRSKGTKGRSSSRDDEARM
jgi:ferritin-like metal-binding protein YciE